MVSGALLLNLEALLGGINAACRRRRLCNVCTYIEGPFEPLQSQSHMIPKQAYAVPPDAMPLHAEAAMMYLAHGLGLRKYAGFGQSHRGDLSQAFTTWVVVLSTRVQAEAAEGVEVSCSLSTA